MVERGWTATSLAIDIRRGGRKREPDCTFSLCQIGNLCCSLATVVSEWKRESGNIEVGRGALRLVAGKRLNSGNSRLAPVVVGGE